MDLKHLPVHPTNLHGKFYGVRLLLLAASILLVRLHNSAWNCMRGRAEPDNILKVPVIRTDKPLGIKN